MSQTAGAASSSSPTPSLAGGNHDMNSMNGNDEIRQFGFSVKGGNANGNGIVHADGRKSFYGGPKKKTDRKRNGRSSKKQVEVDLNTIDYLTVEAKALENLYSSLCYEERLDDALFVIKQSIRAGRDDALKMYVLAPLIVFLFPTFVVHMCICLVVYA